jgi:hypothetical protein
MKKMSGKLGVGVMEEGQLSTRHQCRGHLGHQSWRPGQLQGGGRVGGWVGGLGRG